MAAEQYGSREAGDPSFSIARNHYYGVDYRNGVDLTWYKNIPVPTSYLVTRSNVDFFGGYGTRTKPDLFTLPIASSRPGRNSGLREMANSGMHATGNSRGCLARSKRLAFGISLPAWATEKPRPCFGMLSLVLRNACQCRKQAVDSYNKARNASADYCFPTRPEELSVLEAALRRDPEEARAHPGLVERRDDLNVELATLYNETGEYEKARCVLEKQRLHRWEGGEGVVSARKYPENLGQGKH